MKGFVMQSRFTPGLHNAEDVKLQIGDKVTWRGETGRTERVRIESELRQHASGPYGYEVTFPDGHLAFVSELQIVDWEGKS